MWWPQAALDLSGRSIAILWDLDNLRPPGGSAAATLAVLRLKAAALQWGGCVVSITAYANATTLGSNPRLQGALQDGGATVITVPSHRQAADTAMTSAAFHFAQALRGQAAIVLASNDQGFAGVLRYCDSLGAATVSIGTDHEASRYRARPQMWAKLPLQAAVQAAIQWSFREPLPASAGETQQLAEMALLAGGVHSPTAAQQAAASRGALAASRAGGQKAVWLNYALLRATIPLLRDGTPASSTE